MLRRLLFVGFAVAAAAACSADDTNVADGGHDSGYDAVYPKDAVVGDVASCGPVDVSGYQPEPLTPPNPPHQGKCTTQQASDYAECTTGSDTSLCDQFDDGKPGQTCRQCIETQTTDPRWGVLVFQGQGDGRPNIEGCVDDALGQVSQEKTSGGSGSCGDLLFASYGCQDAACDACTGGDFDTCVTAAVAGQCKSYDTSVESPNGPCAALLDDAAPADVDDCYPDASIVDPTQQEIDWLNRIVGYMCGS